MPTIKVSEFASGRLQSPGLDRAEAFLTEFGMRRAARTKTALYMRGSVAAHHIHLAELGEPRFLSLAFAVADPDDLRRVATLAGASGIESIDEPGGGRRGWRQGPGRPRGGVVGRRAAGPAFPVGPPTPQP